MIKKLTFLFLLIALFCGSLSAQGYVQIGTGTISSPYPSYSGSWRYSWHSAIFQQSEIGAAKQITKLAFDCVNGPKTLNNQKIYLKHTSNSVFSDASYENPTLNGYTLVYDGSITYNNGFTELTLIAPFDYNGTDNLIVHYENRNGSATTVYANFNSTTSSSNNNKSCGSDDGFPTTSGNLNPYPWSLENIRFYYPTLVNPATTPIPVENSIRVALETDIKFTLDASAVKYDVYFGTSSTPTTKIVDNATGTVGVNTIAFSALNGGNLLSPKTDYYWKVVTKDVNGNNPSSTGIYKFTTQQMYSSFPYTQDFTQNTLDPNIVFYPGWYGDITKTDWTYPSSPSNWSCWQVGPGPAPNYTEYYAYMSPFSLVTGNSYSLTSPRFNLTGNYDITFYWMNGNTAPAGKITNYDKTYFEISVDNGENWEILETLEPAAAQTQFQLVSKNLQNKGSAVRFRWRYELTGGSTSAQNVFIDDIEVKVASTSPIINLEQSSYTFPEIYLGGKTTFDLQITNTSSSFPLTILSATAAGPYSCDVNNQTINPGATGTVTIVYTPTNVSSQNTGSITFNTNGATGNNVINLSGVSLATLGSFLETFETTTPNANLIPLHWNQISNYPNDLFHSAQVVTDGANTQVLKIYNNSDIVSPLIAITPGVSNFANNTLTFRAYIGIANQKLQIGLMDDPHDASSFVAVGTPITLTSNMVEYTVNFNAANTKPYIAFKHVGEFVGTPSAIRIDDVEWVNSSVVTVPDPASVVFPLDAATDIDVMNEITLEWTPNLGNPTGYFISIGTTFANPTDIINNQNLNNVTTFTIDNLNFNTTYYWKITPYNAEGNATSVPVWSFTTMVDPTVSTYPWTEGFEANPMPNHISKTYTFRYPMGWSLENNAQPNMCWDKIANGTSTVAHTGNQAMNLWAGFSMQPMNDWFFSPPLYMETGFTYEISFWYKVAIYQSSTSEKMDVFIGNDNTSAAMSTELFSDNSILNEEYIQYVVQYTPSVTGNQYVGFYGYSNALQWILFIDDVQVDKIVSSAANDITSFSLTQQTENAVINTSEKTVSIVVANGTDLTNLSPEIEVSEFAEISPLSGVVQNFTQPVEYTVTAQNGNEAVWTVTVSVTESIYNIADGILVYPNPAKENITLNISSLQKDCYITITDIVGKIISKQDIKSNSTLINLNSFNSGVYFINVYNNNNVLTKKIVVQ